MTARKKTPKKAAKKTTVKPERDPLAVAFGVVVGRRLEAMGVGAKRRLGLRLGATDTGAAGSTVHQLLNVRKSLTPTHFGPVAEFLGLKRSELLREMADELRKQGL